MTVMYAVENNAHLRQPREMSGPSFAPLPDSSSFPVWKYVIQSPVHLRFINAGFVASILLFRAKEGQRDLITILLEDLKTKHTHNTEYFI